MRFKHILWIIAFSFLFTACSAPVSLGRRAIVKAIYVTKNEQQYEVSLAVFTCEPSTDSANSQGNPRIYSGSGGTLDEAISAAEKMQTKKPFYAQNELLLISLGAAEENTTEILQYFGAADAMRQNMSVYLTPCTAEEFAQCEENMSEIVRELERLALPDSGNAVYARNLYEINFTKEGAQGYLPLVEIDAKRATVQVTHLIVLQKGVPGQACSEDEMQLALLLAEKSKQLTLRFSLQGIPTTVTTQNLFLQREVQKTEEQLRLVLHLCGKITTISQNGISLEGEPLKTAIELSNRHIEDVFYELNSKTFLQENDVFSFAWFLRQENVEQVSSMEKAALLYTENTLRFTSALTEK